MFFGVILILVMRSCKFLVMRNDMFCCLFMAISVIDGARFEEVKEFVALGDTFADRSKVFD